LTDDWILNYSGAEDEVYAAMRRWWELSECKII